MEVKMTAIAESKVAQIDGEVCGVMVRKGAQLAAVDVLGRVLWVSENPNKRSLYYEIKEGFDSLAVSRASDVVTASDISDLKHRISVQSGMIETLIRELKDNESCGGE